MKYQLVKYNSTPVLIIESEMIISQLLRIDGSWSYKSFTNNKKHRCYTFKLNNPDNMLLLKTNEVQIYIDDGDYLKELE